MLFKNDTATVSGTLTSLLTAVNSPDSALILYDVAVPVSSFAAIRTVPAALTLISRGPTPNDEINCLTDNVPSAAISKAVIPS